METRKHSKPPDFAAKSTNREFATGKTLREILIYHPHTVPSVLHSLHGVDSLKRRKIFQDFVENLESSQIDVKNYLITIGHTHTKVSLPLLHWAAVFGRRQVLKWLLKRPGYDCLDRDPQTGRTIMHSFVQYGSGLKGSSAQEKRTFEDVLIQYDGCLMAADETGNTPLLSAVDYLLRTRDLDLSEFYIRSFAERAYVLFGDTRDFFNVQNNAGDTALHLLAPYDEYNTVVKFLLENGASGLIRNSEGYTPYEVAAVAAAELNTGSLFEKTYVSGCPAQSKPVLSKQSANGSHTTRKRALLNVEEGLKSEKEELREVAAESPSRPKASFLSSDCDKKREKKSKHKRKSSATPAEEKAVTGSDAIMESVLEAGLVTEFVGSALRQKEKAEETLSELARDLHNVRERLASVRDDLRRRLEGIRHKTGEVGKLLDGLDDLRRTEQLCLERREQAEVKRREMLSKIAHCDRLIAQVSGVEA